MVFTVQIVLILMLIRIKYCTLTQFNNILHLTLSSLVSFFTTLNSLALKQAGITERDKQTDTERRRQTNRQTRHRVVSRFF